MRLINVETFRLEEFFDSAVPPYAIFSHTWGNDNDEVSFRNVEDGNIEKAGIRPIKFDGCCKQTRKDGLRYVWIDTCCIDKTNAVELGEAINSMFQWYGRASVCYTYLADVPPNDNPRNPQSKFFSSRWFQRGWTLQELLAPKKLQFYNSEWSYLGTKSGMSPMIEKITGIPRLFLLGMAKLRDASIAERMSWAAKRVTKRKEDIAYCLLGIFGVVMPMIYGEGDQAFSRLQQEIMKESTDDSILAWGLSLTNPPPHNSTEVISAGVLAAAPSDFVNCGHVVSREQYTMSRNSFEFFGGSLRIHLSIHTTPAGETFGLLKCGSALNAEQVIGIPLEKNRGLSDDYIRPQGRYSVLLPKVIPEVPAKIIHIRKERQSKELVASNRRYWFYIEESVETNLELVEVEPRARWQKEYAMITTANELDGNVIQQTTTRFRPKDEGFSDFIVVLEFEVRRLQVDARCHVMVSSRETPLENVARNLINMRQEALGKQSASNGKLNLHATLRQEYIAGQPMFVLRLATMSSSPEITVDAAWELQHLDLGPKSARRLGGENKIRSENGRKNQQAEEIITNSESSKAQPEVVEQKSRRISVEGMPLIKGLEKGSQISELPLRGSEIEDRQDKVLLKKTADETTANKVSLTASNTTRNDSDIVAKPPLTKNASSSASKGRVVPLQSAAGNGKIDVVKLLLERGAKVNMQSLEGWTPLHSAAHAGHAEVVKLLLDAGADTSIPNDSGWTPLHSSANAGHTEVVKLLLDAGADTSIPNNAGWKPLSSTAVKGHTEVMKLLLDAGADWAASPGGAAPLHLAAVNGRIDVVKLFLELGAKVNVPGPEGWTPLHSAANAGHAEVVKLLLENGADSNIPNDNGWMPISSAAGKGHTKVVELLLEHEAQS